MNPALALMVWCVAAEPVEIELCQVAPAQQKGVFERRADRHRAVVLVQGLRPRPFSAKNVACALPHGWQEPDSHLVRELARDTDVFALCYSQNAAIADIAANPDLLGGIERVKKLGYREIVLVAHSAGGVLARIFVEDHPACGVTRLIQTSAPNTGSGWAGADWFVRHNQEVFLDSLTKAGRQQHLAGRADKKFPAKIECVCLVGRLDLEVELRSSKQVVQERWLQALVTKRYRGDGVVACPSQWPDDLQAQGIPAEVVGLDHYSMVRSAAGAQAIARLVRTPQPRWNEERVRAARPRILGSGQDSSVQLLYRTGKPDDDGLKIRLVAP